MPKAVNDQGEEEGPIGPVTIEILEGLDVIIVRAKNGRRACTTNHCRY